MGDFDIDKFALDRELIKQPNMCLLHTEELAAAIREHDKAKANLDLVKAEVYLRMKHSPEDYGLGAKPTEKAIEQTINGTQSMQEAIAALIDTRHEMEVAKALVSATEHRKRALEGLIQLHLAGYYADPRIKRNEGREEADDFRSRTRNRR